MAVDIQGVCAPEFQAVQQAFEANFAEGAELGARFALAVEGEVVVDLWAGWADRQATRPWAADTLVPVFSVTKAVTALVIARAVDRGRLDYDKPVSDGWPEFAQAGKARVTVGAGAVAPGGTGGFTEAMDPADWFDWELICARLAALEPMWEPGSASGYHPITWGYLAGEMFRRADGRTVGRALAEDLAGPFDLDLWIGLPESEHARVAELVRPTAMADLGEITEVRRAAFLTKWASPGGKGSADWRRAEIPSANGHATAPALARALAVIACDGRLDGRAMLSDSVAEAARRERIAGPDLVLPSTCPGARGLCATPRWTAAERWDPESGPSVTTAGEVPALSPIRTGAFRAPTP
jgi:CubicO group peptidase (beta-lactamase class C family)